jgi:hypothetical protein
MPTERAPEDSDAPDDVGAFDGVDLASRLAPFFPPPVAHLVERDTDDDSDE